VWWRALTGVVLCLVGAVWIGQGIGTVHGSVMTGHSQYAALGAVIAAVGVALLIWAGIIWRHDANRHAK
jgi:hypothetical protein